MALLAQVLQDIIRRAGVSRVLTIVGSAALCDFEVGFGKGNIGGIIRDAIPKRFHIVNLVGFVEITEPGWVRN